MANPLAKRAPAAIAHGSDRPTDGSPYRPDYPYTLQGHVDWINARFEFRRCADRWQIVEQKGVNGSKPIMTVGPVSSTGSEGWERARRAPKVPNMRPPAERKTLGW